MSARAEQDAYVAYRAAEGVNSSWLPEADISMLHFETSPERPRKDTKCRRIGRPIHTCTLEPELFDASIAVWKGGLTLKGTPTTKKNSKAYEEFEAKALADGRQVIDPDDVWLCRRMRRAIMEHPVAGPMVAESETELSIYWRHPLWDLDLKARLDMLCRGKFIADLKSAIDATPEGMSKAATRWKYYRQAAYYQEAVTALTGKKLPFYVIAAEKQEPFDVVVYEMPDAVLDVGRVMNHRSIEKVLAFRESETVTGISARTLTLEFPERVYAELDDGKIYVNGMEVAF